MFLQNFSGFCVEYYHFLTWNYIGGFLEVFFYPGTVFFLCNKTTEFVLSVGTSKQFDSFAIWYLLILLHGFGNFSSFEELVSDANVFQALNDIHRVLPPQISRSIKASNRHAIFRKIVNFMKLTERWLENEFHCSKCQKCKMDSILVCMVSKF